MKIVNIIGGLGNQMFQYAFAMALKEIYSNEKVYIDVSHFKGYKLHNGFEIESLFGKNLPIAKPLQIMKLSLYIPNYKVSRILRNLLPKRRTEYIETQDYIFDSNVLYQNKDMYFEGYWQSAEYFDFIRDKIISFFKINIEDTHNLEIINELTHTESIGIHIRRGDYLNNNYYSGICTLEYYKKGIEHILRHVKDPHFFIFSNDIEWCKNNLSDGISNYKVKYINHNTGNNSYKDMVLMSKCKNLIIANSSFSWWGAYLNEQNGIIVAPLKWVNSHYKTEIAYKKWHLYNHETTSFINY